MSPYTVLMIVSISQLVQEYERAIIFRLGRALPGARGPGMVTIFTDHVPPDQL